tara:strand:- start:1166 stop:2344 length:1179 start_codon:yes stop_codon:yes gene_type:complete
MKNKVETFGCRLNAFESKIIEANLPSDSNVSRVVFNSCAVTSEAVRQVKQSIRKTRRQNPDIEIVVTGCAAQIDPDIFGKMAEVDHVIGNEEKLNPNIWSRLPTERVIVNDIMNIKETAPQMVAGFKGRFRAFAQIQQGCDHRCTFCIIPYGRGNSRSVPIGEIVKQFGLLIKNGYKEFVLTGVDITSYGSDLPGQPRLGTMIKRLLKNVEGIERLRLSSVDPSEIDEDLLDLIANDKRLMPSLHLSVQAGNDLILKRMKRRHLRDDVIKLSTLLREIRPNIVLGADLIAGFPTETEEMFKHTIDLISEAELLHLHIFPYSARTGTPAAKMPQVTSDIKKLRARLLREAGAGLVAEHLSKKVGSDETLLLEQNDTGYTDQFFPMKVSGNHKP